eukprot:TRINITY_DN8221_c0_g1_i1.p2 TRINITY_DN8221_c0_g1~~TRINITY_DN8221_c0_g1_i1.p2  ORF type:complete len:505 (+),score=198.69 TRINITY_DN8221_c0_g1_i1:85-1599(+)
MSEEPRPTKRSSIRGTLHLPVDAQAGGHGAAATTSPRRMSPHTPLRADGSPVGTLRQPWGKRGIQDKQFPWLTAFGEFMFDTSDEAMDRFGVYHNDRVMITKGAWKDRTGTVLGVKAGLVWISLDDEEYVKDLKNAFTKEDLEVMYGIQLMEENEDDMHDPLSPVVRMEFVGARDEAELKAFEYQGPMGTYIFSCRREDTEPFGFHHGQRVKSTRGALRSRCATVIGVLNGILWVHMDDDKTATPCSYCTCKEELLTKFGWRVLRPPRASGGEGFNTPNLPFDKIEYPGPFNQTYVFERGEEALKQFNLQHGKYLCIGRGTDTGKRAVVIGVQAGVMWWHVEGDRAASPAIYCSSYADLEERYKVQMLGTPARILQHGQSVWEGQVTDAERRRAEADEIDAVDLRHEKWGEDRQPQTYRYLRAYARWRLPKNTPAGQSFMLYYVKDTAVRTAEALENLTTLRKFWQLQQRKGAAEFAKPFAQASEKEIVHALQRMPLGTLALSA